MIGYKKLDNEKSQEKPMENNETRKRIFFTISTDLD